VPGDDEVLGDRGAQIVDASDVKTSDVVAVHERCGWRFGNPDPHLQGLLLQRAVRNHTETAASADRRLIGAMLVPATITEMILRKSLRPSSLGR